MKVFKTDFSSLEGTNCYCDPDSAAEIRRRIREVPLHAVHMTGTGDYHYVSLFYLERIAEPFALVLFDNHPDDQQTAFGGDLLSCGGWVGTARSLPLMRADAWFNGVRTPEPLPDGLPVYLSVDLDVLSEQYAMTNWDQGPMSLDSLCTQIREILRCHPLLGVDICGGITLEKGASPADLALNARAEETLCKLFEQYA